MAETKTRLERVTNTIEDLLIPGIDEILPVHRITHELGADSLDFVELIMAIEEEFDIDINEDSLEDKEDWTVQCIVDYLEKRLGPERPPEGSCQIILKDEQQFIDRYKPETDEEGNLWVQREWDGGESEALIKKAIEEGRCWTMVECDGYWAISWGNGVVNRLYNIITEKPIEDQNWIVTVEDDDNQPEWGDDEEE